MDAPGIHPVSHLGDMFMLTRFGLVLGAFIILAAGAATALEVTGSGAINDTQHGLVAIDTTANTNAQVNITFNGGIQSEVGGDNRLVITARGETGGNNALGDSIVFNNIVNTGSIAVNGGNSYVKFAKEVTVSGGIDLDANVAGYGSSASHGDAARVIFEDSVTAGWLRVGNGLNTTRFDDSVTLTGNTTVDGQTYALVIGRGKTEFKGDVVTNGSASSNVLIAGQNNSSDPNKSGATVTFEKKLDAANAVVHIGGNDTVDAAGDFRGDTNVSIAGTGGLAADTVHVGVSGTSAGDAKLTLAAGADVEIKNLLVSDNGHIDNSADLEFGYGGELVFGAGSSYVNNGAGSIDLGAGSTMEIHGGASATAPTQIADMFNRTNIDTTAVVRMVGDTGADTGYFAGDMNIAAGNAATVRVVNNATFAGKVSMADNGSNLEILSDKNSVDAVFQDTVAAGSMYIGATSGYAYSGGGHAAKATFEGNVTVDGTVKVETRNYAGATSATDKIHFKGNLDAGALHLAWGSGHNIFDGGVTLDGFGDGATGQRKASLIVGNRGVNIFNGAVDTTAAYNKPTGAGETAGHVLFTGAASSRGLGVGGESVSHINNRFNVGNASVYIGNHSDLVGLFGLAGAANGDSRVILGSNGGTTGHIEAANVFVGKNGHLELNNDATAKGHIVFGSGSYYAPNSHKLDVAGDVVIQRGAILQMDPSRVTAAGTVVLDTSGGITGDIFNGLYQTSLTNGGKSLSIDGVNSVDTVYGQVFGGVTKNASRAGQLASSVMLSLYSSRQLRTNLAYAVQKAAGYAEDSPGLARAAFSQLFGEHGLTGLTAIRTTARSFSDRVGKRQSAVREDAYRLNSTLDDAASPMAYASLPYAPREYAPTNGYKYDYSRTFNPNRVWAGGFGSWTRQEDRGNQFGYKYSSGGAIIGYDRDVGDFVFGATTAYSDGTVKNNEGFTETDVDTLNIGFYGSYNHPSGFFVDGNLGFGYSWNKVRTDDVITGGRREGKYHAYSLQTGADLGYRFELGGIRLIPSVGAHYTHVQQKSWSEKVQDASMLANWFRRSKDNYLAIPVALKINKTFLFGNSVAVTPEVRGAWISEVGATQARVRVGYVGSRDSARLYGVDSGRGHGLIGLGVKARFAYNLDAFVDYNLEFRGSYKNHNLMGGIGWSF